jgi:hypothetical protein
MVLTYVSHYDEGITSNMFIISVVITIIMVLGWNILFTYVYFLLRSCPEFKRINKTHSDGVGTLKKLEELVSSHGKP